MNSQLQNENQRVNQLVSTLQDQHQKMTLQVSSAVQSENAVSVNITIKHQISGQSTAVVKVCMYICLMW